MAKVKNLIGGTVTLGDSLLVSYKTKYTPAIWSYNCAPWYLPQTGHLCPHKNLHVDIYSSFIHNCQSLEGTKMSYSRWMNKKWWYIQKMESSSVLKRNELSNNKKKWKSHKCILRSERSQSKNATNHMAFGILEKAKTMEIVIRSSGCPKLGEGWIGGAQRVFRVVKILCMIL